MAAHLDPLEGTLESASDMELVESTRNGDSAAFGELWNRHSGAGRSVARSHNHDADDLLAEAFARVFQAISTGGGPTAAFRPYLFTTIRNVSMQWSRQRGADPSEDLDLVADPDSEEEASLAALDKSLTVQAFRSLPTRWQEALWYSEVEQMSSQEIGPLLGMTANAVSALTYRAREGLRQAWIQAHLSRAKNPECATTIERLGSYTRGMLGSREMKRVRDHLGTCASCSIVAEEARQVGSRLALVLLPLAAGVSGAAGFLAWLQTGGTAGSMVAAAAATHVATGGAGSLAGAGASGSAVLGSAGHAGVSPVVFGAGSGAGGSAAGAAGSAAAGSSAGAAGGAGGSAGGGAAAASSGSSAGLGVGAIVGGAIALVAVSAAVVAAVTLGPSLFVGQTDEAAAPPVTVPTTSEPTKDSAAVTPTTAPVVPTPEPTAEPVTTPDVTTPPRTAPSPAPVPVEPTSAPVIPTPEPTIPPVVVPPTLQDVRIIEDEDSGDQVFPDLKGSDAVPGATISLLDAAGNQILGVDPTQAKSSFVGSEPDTEFRLRQSSQIPITVIANTAGDWSVPSAVFEFWPAGQYGVTVTQTVDGKASLPSQEQSFSVDNPPVLDQAQSNTPTLDRSSFSLTVCVELSGSSCEADPNATFQRVVNGTPRTLPNQIMTVGLPNSQPFSDTSNDTDITIGTRYWNPVSGRFGAYQEWTFTFVN